MRSSRHGHQPARAAARLAVRSILTLALALLAGGLQAATDGAPRGGDPSPPAQSRGGRAGPPGQGPGFAPGGGAGRAPGHQVGPGRWWDGAHGHGRAYPAPGWGVRTLPPYARHVPWRGVNYGYYGGVWYAPGAYGYVVARPPFGIVVYDLPVWRTLVMAGGLGYYYANGAYYRERVEGGYEVVPAPVATGGDAGVAPSSRVFVYPRNAQTAEQQASDEYDCHRWAVAQSAFDPTERATGQASADLSGRDDYQRARAACLEGRGYTVR